MIFKLMVNLLSCAASLLLFGVDFIAGGTDDIIGLIPNTDYTGSLFVEYTDPSLTKFDITVGMMDAAGVAFSDSLTQTISIMDNSPNNIGVNTTTFDMLAFHASSGAFGGTDNPAIAGSSTVGEANNGIDISNVTIEFTTTVPEPGSAMHLLAGLVSVGLLRRRS